MGLSTAGRDRICALIIGEAVNAFNNANARLGVGDSTAAFDVSQTDLQAAANKLRKSMDAGYPTRSTNVLTFRATFGTTEGNFAWQEWALFDAASGGVMLSRKVESFGTKSSAQSWQLTVTLTITV